jgi:hypothetical protein
MFLTVCILLALFNYHVVTKKNNFGPNDVLLNDVLLKADLNYFHSKYEYSQYFGSVANADNYENKLRLDVYWEYVERVNGKHLSPPIIVIVPIENQWSYSGVGQIAHTTVSSGIPKDITDILSSYPDYNWDKMDELRFGWVLHPNDEGQRHVTISFINNENTEQPTIPEFMVYFVYFNPINKEGWAKKMLATL